MNRFQAAPPQRVRTRTLIRAVSHCCSQAQVALPRTVRNCKCTARRGRECTAMNAAALTKELRRLRRVRAHACRRRRVLEVRPTWTRLCCCCGTRSGTCTWGRNICRVSCMAEEETLPREVCEPLATCLGAKTSSSRVPAELVQRTGEPLGVLVRGRRGRCVSDGRRTRGALKSRQVLCGRCPPGCVPATSEPEGY